MTKTDLQALAERHGMTLARDPITREGTGYYLQYVDTIAELDDLAGTDAGREAAYPCTVVRERYDDCYTYKVLAPKGWLTLWD